MEFNLDQRTARLSVGEFSDFTLGPRDSLGAPSGLWRAQLGTHWHNQLRAQTTAERADALFEIPISGQVAHRGWVLTLTGRIDQIVPGDHGLLLREIKTVSRDLPADETELRAAYPAYFIQLATYAALARFDPGALSSLPTEKCHVIRDTSPGALADGRPVSGAELHFVEIASGLAQTIALTSADEVLFRSQLERVCEFLDLRLRARERLRTLRFHPPFPSLRPGQETTREQLAEAADRHPVLFFEAPTGFGKTGALLELALTHLRDARCERVLYLTSKATGQLQVVRTLADMTASKPLEKCHVIRDTVPESAGAKTEAEEGTTSVAAWLVRPKHEHCIHTVFHCSRDVCPHIAGAEARWPRSGLSRFYRLENEPRDIASLRAAGREVSICPYEITRAALPFNDVWIGDYNYVFSPSTRGIFFDQPGFDPARTLLVVDEAHNLPARVADAYSHAFSAADASALTETLHRLRAPQKLAQACDHWTHFLHRLPARDALPLDAEDDARDLLASLATLIATTPLDTTQIPPGVSELLWQIPSFNELLNTTDLPRLWWSPRPAELAITCLDAAAVIGPMLRAFKGAVLASATLSPADAFAVAVGLDEPPSTPTPAVGSTEQPARLGNLNKRDTRRLFRQLTSGADLLRHEEAREIAAPTIVRAEAPWRDHAYDIAIDVRVDTSYQQRARHTATTAATLAHLAHAASRVETTSAPARAAAFFPSYAYAETILRALEEEHPHVRVTLQPRLPDLAAQSAWVDQALASADLLFLVLGSSFAEGIDLLGGRISHALVAGPALPEVNAVQRARLAAFAHHGRDTAARRVYQIPGIQKVNQALGRLVRAPGQQAKVLLHCRRFAEESYTRLLAPEYRTTHLIEHDTDLIEWL